MSLQRSLGCTPAETCRIAVTARRSPQPVQDVWRPWKSRSFWKIRDTDRGPDWLLSAPTTADKRNLPRYVGESYSSIMKTFPSVALALLLIAGGSFVCPA